MSVAPRLATHARPDSDAAFDALVPPELRHLSAVHWTPLSVAVRAARWLAPAPAMRVLDVGSGVGKLCAIGALWTRAAWHGVEQHRANVLAAIDAADLLGVRERTCFVHADALSIDWTPFDAFYFYNPFEMLLITGGGASRRRYGVLLAQIVARLDALRPGTRVVTYHGLGADLPGSYRRVRRENLELGDLELWIRSDGRRSARG